MRLAERIVLRGLRTVLPGQPYENLRKRYLIARSDFVGPSSEAWDKVIFIHIPKAAGSSILSTGVYQTSGHKPFRFYERARPKRDFQCFAVVRHPFNRFISAFHYLQKGGGNAMDATWARRHKMDRFDASSFAVEMLPQRSVLQWLHFQPQIDFLIGQDNEIAITDILRFEQLDTTWPEFAREHGLKEELPHVNVVGKSSADILTDAARDSLRKVYADDFERIGF